MLQPAAEIEPNIVGSGDFLLYSSCIIKIIYFSNFYTILAIICCVQYWLFTFAFHRDNIITVLSIIDV